MTAISELNASLRKSKLTLELVEDTLFVNSPEFTNRKKVGGFISSTLHKKAVALNPEFSWSLVTTGGMTYLILT